jgi:REP element-mobilizing transposase RayT
MRYIKTEYHLVWIARYRRKIFVKGVKEYAEKILLCIFKLDPDIEVIKVNVQEDHVHMVIVIPPRIAVAKVIQFIKTRSALVKIISAKAGPINLHFYPINSFDKLCLNCH